MVALRVFPEALEIEEIKMLAMLQKKIRNIYSNVHNRAVDRDIKSFVQPLLEARYAWEHFADALLDADGNWNTDIVVIAKETSCARSHMLRCYTDLTEWRFIRVKMYAKRKTRWRMREDIESAIPGYYSEIFPLFNETERLMTTLKGAPEQLERVEQLDRVNRNCDIILNVLEESALEVLAAKTRWFTIRAALGAVLLTLFGAIIALLLNRL